MDDAATTLFLTAQESSRYHPQMLEPFTHRGTGHDNPKSITDGVLLLLPIIHC